MAKRFCTLENMDLANKFWGGKRVFLTGHTGFKGSWLSLWLQNLGAQVTGFALAPATQPSLFDAAKVAEGMVSHLGDIRNADAIEQAIVQDQPEIVIHMAAQPLVRYSYANPVETYATNVMGLVNVLEAIRKTPSIKAVVNVTTDKCYENHEIDRSYREEEAMGGYDPYSSSKGCAELVSSAYRRSYGIPLATARAGNVIGGGDWAEDRLIPDILRAIEEGQPINIRNPLAIRPWQHVLEPLSGYLTLAEKLYQHGSEYAEAWNFGPAENDAKPVQWIVEHLTKHWGNDARWQLDGGNNPHEAHYLKLDCSKAKAQLGWKPRWDLSQALEKIMTWHQAFLAQSDMKAITLQQIQTYSSAH